MKNDLMPCLRPIPIDTKTRGFFGRVWALFSVVRQWEVVEDWRFQLSNGVIVIIPKGFIFDGASIPKPLWSLLSPTGLLLTGGLIHDFAYRYNYLWAVAPGEKGFGKYQEGAEQKYWDDLFFDINVDVNGMVLVDYVTWFLLRAFGFVAWGNNRLKCSRELTPGLNEETKNA